MREMFEETGLDIPLLDGFRYSFEYIIPKYKEGEGQSSSQFTS